MDLGELEMRIEVDDAQAGRCGGLSAENLRKTWRVRGRVGEEEGELAARDARVR